MRHRLRNKTFVDDGKFVYLNPPVDSGSGQQNVMPPPTPPPSTIAPYPVYPYAYPYAIPVNIGYPPIYEDEIIVYKKPEKKDGKKKFYQNEILFFGLGVIALGIVLKILK